MVETLAEIRLHLMRIDLFDPRRASAAQCAAHARRAARVTERLDELGRPDLAARTRCDVCG